MCACMCTVYEMRAVKEMKCQLWANKVTALFSCSATLLNSTTSMCLAKYFGGGVDSCLFICFGVHLFIGIEPLIWFRLS